MGELKLVCYYTVSMVGTVKAALLFSGDERRQAHDAFALFKTGLWIEDNRKDYPKATIHTVNLIAWDRHPGQPNAVGLIIDQSTNIHDEDRDD